MVGSSAISAIYLINRIPTSSLKEEVPATLWFGEKANLKKVKIFGCLVYLHLPRELIAGKFDSKIKKCIIVGYCVNGYRLWCPEDGKIILGRDVKFDESRFEYEDDEWHHYRRNDNVSVDKEEIDDVDSSFENFESADEDAELEQIANKEDDIDAFRRSSRTRKQPAWHRDYVTLACNAESYVEDVPCSYEQIFVRDDKNEWFQAVKEEMDAINENKTWYECDLPAGRKAIDTKWIFKVKHDESINIKRYKARLVIRGCAQKKGFDCDETYAPDLV